MQTLMERAGRAVAEEALRRYPDAQSFGAVCGGGANGGDGRIALDVLRSAGKGAEEGTNGDVLIDALFGTGFHGEPRPEAAAADRGDQRRRGSGRRGRPAVRRRRRHGRDRRRRGARRRDRDDARPQGRTRGCAGQVPRRRGGRRRHRARAPRDQCGSRRRARCSAWCRASAKPTTSTRPGRSWSSAARRAWPVRSRLTASAAFRADAGYVTICSEVEPSGAGGGEAAARGGVRRGAAPRRAGGRPRPRAIRREARARPPAARGDRAAGGRRRRCALRARAVRRALRRPC